MKRKRQTVEWNNYHFPKQTKQLVKIHDVWSKITTIRLQAGIVASVILFIGNKLIIFPQDAFVKMVLSGNMFLDYTRSILLVVLIAIYSYFLFLLRNRTKEHKLLIKEVLNDK